MSEHLGPIEIRCDAPPYDVVQACHLLDFHAPEDVRWCRLHYDESRTAGPRPAGVLGLLWAVAGVHDAEACCSCGAPLPTLRVFRMAFNNGETACYLLGQCERCHTVFWDEP
jgi:hypothetical protein